MLDFDDVRAFCLGREVELVMAPPPPSFVLCLHGEYDGYGDFFSLVARSIEYVELPYSLVVGDLFATNRMEELASLSPKWSHLVGSYSGPALAFRDADAPQWGSRENDFVLVANSMEWRPGRDWQAGSARK